MNDEAQTKYKMDKLRKYAATLAEQDATTTAKLMKKLTDQENEFISSFDAEAFMELQSLREMSRYLSLILERFDAGKMQLGKDAPICTDPQEIIDYLIEQQSKKILRRARRVSFSSSPASNQMENYAISMAVKVVELFDW